MVHVKSSVIVELRIRLWFFVFVFLFATDVREVAAPFTGLLPGSARWGTLGCKPCAIDPCVNATKCRGGVTMDACNCCTKCLNVQGELCGGIFYRLGKCDKNLFCNITGPFRRDPVGRCTPMVGFRAVSLQDTAKQPEQVLIGNSPTYGDEQVSKPSHDQHTNEKTLDEVTGEHKKAIQPQIAPAVAFVACSGGLLLILWVAATCITTAERRRLF